MFQGHRLVRRAVGISCLGIVLVAVGCTSARSLRVESHLGPGAPLDGSLKTFAWMPETQEHAHSDWAQLPGVRPLFREMVQSKLTEKGYQLSSAGTADYLLSDRLVAHVMDDPLWQGKRLRYAILALDAVDAKSRLIAWHASADLQLNPSISPKQVEATLRLVVRRMLSPVPSRSSLALQ